MNKKEFFERLKGELSAFPEQEVNERLDFYEEIIDDRMEEGLSEEEAIEKVGTLESIKAQITEDIPLSIIVKGKVKPKKKLKTWEKVCLIVGSPIWVSVLLAAFAVILSLYIVLWALDITLCCIDAAFAASSAACVIGSIYYACSMSSASALCVAGAGLIFGGISVLMFFGCKSAIKGTLKLAKRIVVRLKLLLV